MKLNLQCPKCDGRLRPTVGRFITHTFGRSRRCEGCGTVWTLEKRRFWTGLRIFDLITVAGLILIWMLWNGLHPVAYGVWVLLCWAVIWPIVLVRFGTIETEVKPQ